MGPAAYKKDDGKNTENRTQKPPKSIEPNQHREPKQQYGSTLSTHTNHSQHTRKQPKTHRIHDTHSQNIHRLHSAVSPSQQRQSYCKPQPHSAINIQIRYKPTEPDPNANVRKGGPNRGRKLVCSVLFTFFFVLFMFV